MRVQLELPETSRILVRYNGEEIFTGELEAGIKHDFKVETPEVTGRAELFIVGDDGSETLVVSAEYDFEED